MKASIIIISLFLFVIPSLGQSKSKAITSTIKVYGNCGMCKERIESALDQKGIKKATWDVATKNLTVIHSPSKITEQQICELLAAVGHDTDKAKAKDEVYAGLPFCCLYRDHDHSGMEDGKKNHDH
ncbi:heavy-metal-associated domain-containing protein [Oscillatoria amoena NRMC-F 0135]|nr:heavy-metal-associated domain-containing protein [Oscillatoria amoena NRMC-F 0135]